MNQTNFLTLSVSILSYLTAAPLVLTVVVVVAALVAPTLLFPPNPRGLITLFLILGLVKAFFLSFYHSCFKLAWKHPEPLPTISIFFTLGECTR